jgi:hypothetical protein
MGAGIREYTWTRGALDRDAAGGALPLWRLSDSPDAQPIGGPTGSTVTRLGQQGDRLFVATLTTTLGGVNDSVTGLRLGVANGHRVWRTDKPISTPIPAVSIPVDQLLRVPSAGNKPEFVQPVVHRFAGLSTGHRSRRH